MTCPDDDAIDRFTSGGAGEAEAVEIREHLPECAACRRLVSALVKESVASEPVEASDSGGGPLLRGTQIARYLIIDFIGAGAMGMVYAAYDPQLDRKVALKLLHPDSAAAIDQAPLRARMLREAQAMARLVHPNVVAIHDAGVIGERIHIAMDLVEGRSVRAWLAEKPRTWREIVDVYVQAGRGLAAAHRAGLVHRDFKPDNILVGRDGRALVTDFGMASVGAAEGAAAPARRAAPPHADRHDDGDTGVHGARAADGRSGRRARRHLRLRGVGVGRAFRRAPISQRRLRDPASRRARREDP